ncbi:PQQ-dependent sugar dehydrogenase [Demequina salsinemoris]|uniref:PQQ-dependent sugar dehydrogenase n=1 Tax=Demequina salsinemoris TaxID=577470 RepID=UPI000780AB93|nr:hypothetical protein [Demequina salsinemoris]
MPEAESRTTRVARGGARALAGALALIALAACDAGGTTIASTQSAAASAPATSGTPATAASSTSSASSAPDVTFEIGDLEPVALTVADGTDPGAAEGRALNLPHGWTAEVWADVPGARLAAWSPDGSLLVSTGDGGAVWALTPTSDGVAPDAVELLVGLNGPQGLAFTEEGTTLVVGELNRLVAFDYAEGAVSDPVVLIDGLPTDGHGKKAVAIQGDTVYYSLGSSGNRSPADRTADPERAVVAAVGLDGTGDRVVAHGVRNGFALDTAPDGSLFVAVNQMDNLPYPYDDGAYALREVATAFVNDHPIEQLTRVTDGVDLGWPYCVPDSRAGVTALPFVNDAELNPSGEQLDCAALPDTMVGLPAHSAPLGLTFTHDTALADVVGWGALIGAHGSWNRTPPQQPYVAFAAWDDATGTLGEAHYLVTGFQDDDGTRWGRAVMPTVGPDGAIYLTDDAAGLVYRIVPA